MSVLDKDPGPGLEHGANHGAGLGARPDSIDGVSDAADPGVHSATSAATSNYSSTNSSTSGSNSGGANRWATLRYLWTSDLYRHLGGATGFKAGLRAYRLVPGFRFMFWLRLAAATRGAGGLAKVAHVVARLMHKHYKFKFGISIPWQTEIGPGFYIGHYGGIVVNEAARIGRNVNISHSVTIGQVNRGRRKGVPTIGDGVYIGPGAAIIGALHVGSGSAIGANAVVTSDLCVNAVAVGIPARVISTAGNEGYVEHCDYPPAPGEAPATSRVGVA